MEFEGRTPIKEELSLAPLIDVVLLLLIFFMLTSTFYVSEGIELTLPQSTTAEPLRDEPVVVALNKTGSIALNGEPITLEQLVDQLPELLGGQENPAVTLKTDAEVSVQAMLQVMDAIRSAGGRHVSIATEGAQ